PGSAHWRFFGEPWPRSEARRSRVEKCPARGGITISKCLAFRTIRGDDPCKFDLVTAADI
ncbi:MAG: hypothetical protein Q8M86_01470, partial [Syntrophales bacterium]|nr:hypothetical protein [Syntrophales bacterium]